MYRVYEYFYICEASWPLETIRLLFEATEDYYLSSSIETATTTTTTTTTKLHLL